jgi:biopolymer transport protein TolR
MARLRKKRGKRVPMPEVTLTPLIDTFATLLLIFMVATPMVQNAIRVDLPHGKSKEVTAQQELIVTLDKKNKLFFNSYPIERSSLAQAVQKALVQKEDLPVYVQADEAVEYGKVIGIVDELKQAGVKFVAMSTRNPR